MKRLANSWSKHIRALFNNKKSIFVVAFLVYSMTTLYYMWPVIGSCTDTLMAAGDATAGPIARYSILPDNPLWGFTKQTNYPVGEQLNQPVSYSAGLQYTLFWIFAKLVGPVCGFNLLNFFGFVSSAMIMFSFARWLTKRDSLALLAGYAVAFTPYLQIKVGGHPGYGYLGLLVLVLWFSVLLWKEQRYRWILGLGLSTAACFYFDPYFILLAAVIIFCAVPTLLIKEYYDNKNIKTIITKLKYFTAAGILITVLVSPLLYIRIHYSAEINSFTSGARDDIFLEAQTYGSGILEYLQPPDSQPVLRKVFGDQYVVRNHHGSNAGEYTVSLSITMMVLVMMFLVVYGWERIAARKNKETIKGMEVPLHYVVPTSLVVGFMSFLLSLPPKYGNLTMPSYYLVSLTSTWRTISRLYIVINIFLVILFVCALYYFNNYARVKKTTKIAAFALILFAIVFEYQIFYPFNRPSWSYKEDVPKIYSDIKRIENIDEIAEYPLDDLADPSALATAYLTNQPIHGKKLLNSALPSGENNRILGSLRDITDPQTVPALRALGIDAITVRGELDDLNLLGLEKLLSSREFGELITLYRILPGPKSDFVILPKAQSMRENTDDNYNIFLDYPFDDGIDLDFLPTGMGELPRSVTVCVDITNPSASQVAVELIQKGKMLETRELRPQGKTTLVIEIEPNKSLNIISRNNTVDLALDKLGCR